MQFQGIGFFKHNSMEIHSSSKLLCVSMLLLVSHFSLVRLFATSWPVAHQVP